MPSLSGTVVAMNEHAAEFDLERLVQSVTDSATELCRAEFGAFFYNVEDDERGKYMLYTISGVPREAFERFPMPRATSLFGPTFRGEGVVRIDDVLQDPRYGKSGPYYGMPPGHLPVRSYLAVPVVSRAGVVEGGLFFGHSEVGVFSEEHEFLVSGIAAQAAVAIENARLYAERSRLATIVETSHDAILGTTLNGSITSWNPGAERLFGYSSEEATGLSLSMLVPEEREHELAEALGRVHAGHPLIDLDTVCRTRDGRRINVLLTLSPLSNAAGNVTGASVFIRDITEKKRAESDLRESEERFRTLADAIPQLAWAARADGYIYWYNQRWYDYTGTTPEQMEGWGWQRVHDPRALPEVMERWKHSIETGEPFNMVFPLRAADGSYRPFLTLIKPLKDESGRILHWFGTNTDISQQQAMEEALRESEARFRRMADTVPVLIWTADIDNRSIWFNKPWLDFTGRPLDDELGDGWTAGIHPEDRDGAIAICNRAFELRQPFQMEFRLRRADGEYRYVLDTGIPQYSGDGFVGFIGSCIDVTEQRRAQAAQAHLAAIVEYSDDAVISKDLEGIVQTWNSGAERIFGYSAHEIVGQSITTIIPPERIEEERDILNRMGRGERIEHFDTIRMRKDGGRVHVSITISPILDPSGRIIGASNVSRDISDRKKAEGALRDYAGRLTAIFETAVDGIITIDEAGRIESVNPAAIRLFGYERDELYGQNVRMLMPEPYHGEHDRYISNYLRTGERQIIGIGREVIGRRKDGSTFPMELGVSETVLEDGARVFTGLVRDISERKRSLAALQEYAGRLAAIFNTAVDAIITINDRGQIESSNPAVARVFGYVPEEIVGKNIKMLMPEPYHSEHDAYISNYLRTGEPKVIGIGREVIGRRKDGTLFPMELAVSETQVGDGRIFTGIVRDISARKQHEETLREREARLRLAVGNAPLILCHCDAQRRFTWFAGNVADDRNGNGMRFSSSDHQADFRMDNILGRTAEELIGEQAKTFVDLQDRVLETGQGARGEVTVDTPLGRRTWDAAVEAVKDDAGRVMGLTVAALDITERKVAEERQQMLLAELSHRVKNTLATVQSIATQTLRHCTGPLEFRESFEARLHSLAHTHSLLTRGQWRGADLRAIVAGELSPHAVGDPARVRIDGPRLYLSPKAALSLHLVFHELATNAAKYGALSGPDGRVEVSWDLAKVDGEAELRLFWVESDGPRVSPPARRGFGSVVIENSLQYELDGKANVDYREEGLHCEFLVPWSEAVGFVQLGT